MYLLVAIFLLILITFFFKIRLPFENKKAQMWAMSFGGGAPNFHDAVDRIHNELNDLHIYDKIVIYKDDTLKKDTVFWEKHSNFFKNNTKGYGYWLWKPYLILKTLDQMNTGDVLFYLDSGCEIKKKDDSLNRVIQFNERCKKNTLLYTLTVFQEKQHTKMDLFHELDITNEYVKDTTQKQATMMVIKKNNITLEFLKDWYTFACDYHLIDDSHSIEPNDSSFIEHRHDQSIFSLLIKSDKYKSTMDNPENIIDNSEPFLLNRKRSG